MAHGTAQSISAQRPTRYEFLDLFRGIAVLLMIEGHAMRALLDWQIRATLAYDFHELFHGLPAPIFIFAAGAALGITGEAPSRPSSTSARTRNWRRELRLLNVLIVAYALQLSDFSFVKTFFASSPERLVTLLNFNVLQCIVAGVLLVRCFFLLKLHRRSLVGLLIGGTFVVGLLTPIVWRAAPQMPLWIATTISRHYASYFPLFPYLGFALAGAAWGLAYQLALRDRREASFLRRTIEIGGLVFIACTALAGIPWPELYSEFWWSSPWYLWLRIGLLMMLCAYLRRAEMAVAGKESKLYALLVLLGRRSFYVYVAHLIILYGSSYNYNWNMVRQVGKDLTFVQGALATFCLAMFMVGSAIVWDWTKRNRPVWSERLKWSLAAYLIAVFAIS